MKPFDLELAKQNHPVQTKNGRPVRIVCYDVNESFETTCILALVKYGNCEIPYKYTFGGSCMENEKRDLDLVMASNKKEGWINIYQEDKFVNISKYWCSNVYKTEEDAIAHRNDKYIATIKINWEE